ncbi:TetR/AcrR family transcriptional regulator [Phenylobacterium sp.]|jgi:AcrR family transcriptional regulator|uniref:TetR/AcrR family transcriptional regulator n=1 Tax=Phenylobacterium sp. TaxID=1871053 RepID=UPI002F421416
MAIKPGSLGRPAGPTHRTHEERSAATQQKIIDAAIHCLRTYGYAATSTTMVVEIAQLSRGAMLHQFGTKVDLMLAVAKYVVESQNKFMAEALETYPPGRERFIALTEVTWQALSQPGAIALLEIMMASRSDADLGARFPAVAEELAVSQRKGAWYLAKQAGITDRKGVDAMSQLHRAAMQGLSINMMFTKDPDSLKPMLELLHRYKEATVDQLIAASDPPSDRIVRTRINAKRPR